MIESFVNVADRVVLSNPVRDGSAVVFERGGVDCACVLFLSILYYIRKSRNESLTSTVPPSSSWAQILCSTAAQSSMRGAWSVVHVYCF